MSNASPQYRYPDYDSSTAAGQTYPWIEGTRDWNNKEKLDKIIRLLEEMKDEGM